MRFPFVVPIIILGFMFFLSVSTVGSNIFFGLSVIASVIIFFISMRNVSYKEVLNQPFISFFAFFFLMLVITLFSKSTVKESLVAITGYLEIFFIPLMAFTIARTQKLNIYCVLAFMFAMLVTLIFSYDQAFGKSFLVDSFALKENLKRLGGTVNPTVFKLHITHNFFMSFACLCFAYGAYYFWSARRLFAFFLALLCCVSFFNIFFMVQGRTGYLVFLVCLTYLFISYSGLKGVFGFLIFAPMALVILFTLSPGFQDRVFLGFSELYAWNHTLPSSTSMGLRLEFIYNSLRVSSEHLFFGVGIGNFYSAYGSYLDSSSMVKSTNPHNQYILFLVEIGIVGLIAFLYLNYVCWKSAARLSLFWKHSTRIVLLGYGVGNLFNSFLTDAAESLFFSAFMAVAFSELLSGKNIKSTA